MRKILPFAAAFLLLALAAAGLLMMRRIGTKRDASEGGARFVARSIFTTEKEPRPIGGDSVTAVRFFGGSEFA